MYKEEKELWVRFACAALANSVSTLEDRIDKWNARCVEHAEDWTDEEDQIAEDCSYAAQYADNMLSLFYDKFKDC